MRVRTAIVIGIGFASVLVAAAMSPEKAAPFAGEPTDCAPDIAQPSPPRQSDTAATPKHVGSCAAARSRAEQTEDAVYIMRRNGPPETQMLL